MQPVVNKHQKTTVMIVRQATLHGQHVMLTACRAQPVAVYVAIIHLLRGQKLHGCQRIRGRQTCAQCRHVHQQHQGSAQQRNMGSKMRV